MRVLALGGAGEFGRPTLAKLAADAAVTEIVVAGRNLERAKEASSALGEKGRPASVDILDHERLVSLAKGSDLLLNTAGPEWEVILEVLRTAIEAGVNYCDLGAHGPTFEKALEMDAAAKAKGVTALLGMGENPGLTNLLLKHAADQLDEVTSIVGCYFLAAQVFSGWMDALPKTTDKERAGAAWQMFVKWGTPPFRVRRSGSLASVDGRSGIIEAPMPRNGRIPAVECGGIEHVSLPRSIPGIRDIHTVISWYPFRLNETYLEMGARGFRGEIDASRAAQEFFEAVVQEIKRGEPVPGEFLGNYIYWAEATGTRDGKNSCYACWPAKNWFSTSAALATGALKLLKGEVKVSGVVTAENCFEPLAFFKDESRYVLKSEAEGSLLNEIWATP